MEAPINTRFAPTASGHLHIGSLANLLLSYIVARRTGGKFYVRMDRHPDQRQYEIPILQDIAAFGFVADEVILARERESHYREIVDQILETHRPGGQVYFCDCSPEDITCRAARGLGSKTVYLHREEKYPSPCNIRNVRAFSMNDPENNLIDTAEVHAPTSSRYHPPENVLDDTSSYWAPRDVGYLGHYDPELSFHWDTPVWISRLEIRYAGLPLKAYGAWADTSGVEVLKPCAYYYSPRPPEETMEILTFPPGFTKTLKIVPKGYMHQVKKEYYYDGHCRERGLPALPLNDRKTSLRTRGDGTLPDVALWFDSGLDLCCTSIIDDLDYDIGLRVRGADIEPFTWLESEAAKLVAKAKPPNLFHPMLCDVTVTKFSKFIGSPRAVDYLGKRSPDEVLSYVAHKLGILPLRGTEILSLEELIEEADLNHLEDPRNPIVCQEVQGEGSFGIPTRLSERREVL